jgi:hypothetical protein
MVTLTALWLPILLSAVLVFIASSIIHMLTPWHKNDVRAVPGEDQVRAALRPFNLPPGDYVIPKAGSMKEMGTPEYQAKLNEGPVAMITVWPNGPMAMGGQLVQWFVYCVIVGLFAAYVASRTLPADETYLSVFRITGTVAFAGYGLALIQQAIWYRRNPAATMRSLVDALLYALLTAGVFGWRWPSA